MKKWLDKYEAPKAQNGIEGTMGGLTDKGFNYNGAWGGQFQMGGNVYPVNYVPQSAMGSSIPGSVGFTYARTNSPAPSEGPYAKKTMPSAQNGQEMRYYQEGLDWKPKTISRDGSVIPTAQTGEFYRPNYVMPRASGESTSLGTKIDEAAIRQAAITKQRRNQGEIKKAGPKRSAVDKALAIATHPMTALQYKVKGQDIPENFERGERNSLDYAIDVINPAGIAEAAVNLPENVSKGNFTEAGLNVLSMLPLASEFAKNPLVRSAAKTVYDIPRAESIREAVGRVAGIPLKKDLPRMSTEDVKALRQVQEIGRLRDTGSRSADQMKYALENKLPEEHFQKVFGRSREEAQQLLDSGFGQQEAARSAEIRGNINLQRPPGQAPRPNPELARLREQGLPSQGSDFDVTPEELNRGQRNLMHELFGDTQGLNQEELRDRLSALEREIADDDIDNFMEIRDDEIPYLEDLGTSQEEIDAAINSPEGQSLRERFRQLDANHVVSSTMPRSQRVQDALEIFSQPGRQYGQINPEDYEGMMTEFAQQTGSSRPSSKEVHIDLSRSLGRAQNSLREVNKKLDKKLENLFFNTIQEYPYFSGNPIEKVPSLHLSSSGSLKDVSKKVDFAPEGISSGDIFTGSVNTSHSSYLPQLKQIFKYDKGNPQFLGYRPMNELGFLSRYGYGSEDVAKYLNSEIDEQIKRGILPKSIQRPFVQEDAVILPHYAVKQKKKGGVIKDDRGQWAHPGEITEIGSNRITMQGVPYPVLGISDQGDTQMMYPEQEYKFEGDSVTEIPMAKQGSSNVKAERLSNFYKNLFENVSKRGDEKKNVSFMDRALGSIETVLENPRDAISSLFAKKERIANPLDNPYGVEVFGNTKTYTDDKGKTITQKKRWLPKYYIPTDGQPPSKGPGPRKPIYTTDPKKVRAYQDSLNLYNQGFEKEKFLRDHGFTKDVTHEFPFSKVKEYGSYANKPKPKDRIQPISAVSQEKDPSHPSYYKADWVKYKKPVQPYVLQDEPTLNRRVLEAQRIPMGTAEMPEMNLTQLPQVEMPPVSMGEYDVSYWDPEAKDWASRTFPTEEASQSFAQEMTNRGYAAPYGNVTQTKKVNQKRNGSWLDGYK